MQTGEETRPKVGETIDRTLHTLAGVPYKIKFCACCSTLFREVVDEEEEAILKGMEELKAGKSHTFKEVFGEKL